MCIIIDPSKSGESSSLVITHLRMKIMINFELLYDFINYVSIELINIDFWFLIDVLSLLVLARRHCSVSLRLILVRSWLLHHAWMHFRMWLMILRILLILMVWLKVTYWLLYLIIIMRVFHSWYIKFNYKTLTYQIYYLNKINSPRYS
jgi:hypothetical protein